MTQSMKRPAFEVIEKKSDSSEYPLLVIDKKGVIGALLAKDLENQGTVVFVCANEPSFAFENLVYVPYHGRIPEIPDNAYGEIFLVAQSREEVLEFLPGLVAKAGDTKSSLLIVVHLSLRGKEFEETLLSHRNVRIVYYGDMFGEEIFLTHSDLINTFLRQALNGGRIEVPKDGMEKTFPVYYKDVLMGILEAAYGRHTSRVFFLFPKHCPTQLMVARSLQKTEPLLRIDFTGQDFAGISVKEYQLHSGGGIYLLEEHYPLEKKLQKAFHELLSSFSLARKHIPSLNKDTEITRLSKKSTRLPRIHLGFLLFFLSIAFVAAPLIMFALTAVIGAKELLSAKHALERGDIESAKKSAQIAETMFMFSSIPRSFVEKEASLIGKRDAFGVLTQATATGKDAAAMIAVGAEGLSNYKSVLVGNSNMPARDFTRGSESIKQALTLFAKIRAENTKDVPGIFKSALKDISAFDGLSNLVIATIDTYPDVFGFLGERKYLVLFQNNMELRPGGGFIGSFGLLTVKDGKTKEFVLQDVYDADGQLKGHIEPPFALRRYLPIAHWYLRDSNFNVDYTKGATISALLLEQEIGQRVDGVIGIDVTFLKKLLEVTGPIFVSEYNETVTPENMYSLTQLHAEKDFFPGSTQKKDFLRALSQALQSHFSTKGSNYPYLALGKVLQEAVMQKHVIFAFADPAIQNVFTINDMSSSLWDNRQVTPDEIVDAFGISEANLGANKVNHFMRRKISQDVTIDAAGNIKETVTIRYKNTSTEQNMFGGEYKAFLRIIAPLGTKVTGIIIDGQEQKIVPAITNPATYEARNFRPPNGLEVETVEQENKSIFGFLMLVPEDSFKTVIISYMLPQKISLDIPSFVYKQKIFKQPGTEGDLFSFRFVYTSGYKIFAKPQGAKESNGIVQIEEPLLTNLNFSLQFSRK